MMHSAGRIVRALALGGRVRVVSVVADPVADEVRRRHHLSPKGAKLAAEGVVATGLLAAYIKGDERLMFQVQGTFPDFSFIGEIDAEGNLRARLQPADLKESTQVRGTVLTVKWNGHRELYRGVVRFVGEGLDAAVDELLSQSQQATAVARLGVTFNPDGAVHLAAGLLVERVPGEVEDADFEGLVAPLLTTDITELMTRFAFGELLGEPVEVLEASELRHSCSCSRQRVEATLAALGADDLRALEQEQGEAVVDCHFCNEHYVVPGARLLALAAELDLAH